jgi:hypothetical protein
MSCVRLTTKKYLTRNSPPYHANDCKNKIIKGNDGKLYISSPDKNNVYKWILHEEEKEEKIVYKSNPDEYYKQYKIYQKPLYNYKPILEMLPEIKKELKKIGIVLYFYKWNKWSTSPFWIEYAYEDLNIGDSDYILITEKDMYAGSIKENGFIRVLHDIPKEKQEAFNEIFMRYFPKKTIGFETKHDIIKIFFEEQKKFIRQKQKTIFDVTISFKTTKIPIYGDKVIERLQKLPKNIGYMDMYDAINKIYVNIPLDFNAQFNINFDKSIEFKDYINNLKKEFPILKIKIEKF